MQARFTDRNGTPIPEDARLYRILVTETAHLIWKIRCQRVIEENNIPKSQTEIHNRWTAAINERLQLDCLLADPKLGSRALKKEIVLKTWKGLLKDEDRLLSDWTRRSKGVLVGIPAI